MTIERRALDKLLEAYPEVNVLSIDWQLPDNTRMEPGPWLMVTIDSPRREFAIWKRTGAIHNIGFDGAVIDPPFIPGE